MTRHAKPILKLSKSEKEESEELNNLLYALHTTPVMDHIGLSTIARETASDEVLKKVVGYVRSGKTWIDSECCGTFSIACLVRGQCRFQ